LATGFTADPFGTGFDGGTVLLSFPATGFTAGLGFSAAFTVIFPAGAFDTVGLLGVDGFLLGTSVSLAPGTPITGESF
jgi:hypothetical protein